MTTHHDYFKQITAATTNDQLNNILKKLEKDHNLEIDLKTALLNELMEKIMKLSKGVRGYDVEH